MAASRTPPQTLLAPVLLILHLRLLERGTLLQDFKAVLPYKRDSTGEVLENAMVLVQMDGAALSTPSDEVSTMDPLDSQNSHETTHSLSPSHPSVYT